MSTLWVASLGHLARHPAQLALALVGLTLGVATIVAVDIATASSSRALQLSLHAVNGAATHHIQGGPAGLDERLYAQLRRVALGSGTDAVVVAPMVQGYATLGERTLQLIGIDPFASAELEGPGAGAAWRLDPAHPRPTFETLRDWLTVPGAVLLPSDVIRELGARLGDTLQLEVDGVAQRATLIGALQADARDAGLLLTDVANAQEWLGLAGRLSRIDARIPAGARGADLSQQLRARLPSGVELQEAGSRARESLEMTSAFTTNLRAMSLLALLVGALLIYAAVSFAVIQRRRVMGVLRALGATRAQILRMVLIEAAVLGLVGALLGLACGAALGRTLVRLVSRTINDLYFVVVVNETSVPLHTALEALAVGLGTALVAALLPALEVAASAPHLGTRRSVLESRVRTLAGRLAWAAAVLAGAAGLLIYASSRSLLAGFTALFLLLLSVAALTPAALDLLARSVARASARASPIARLALNDIAGSLSRTGVAVAALGIAIAAMIGVSIMVESFRESLRDWLQHTLRADIYVTAPGPGAGRPERRLEAGLIPSLLAAPEIAGHSESRRVMVETTRGPVPLDALKLLPASYAGLQLISGSPASLPVRFEAGEVLVSEPLAWRLRLAAGDQLTFHTPEGDRPLRIAAIFREYGNDRGTVFMSRSRYVQLWHDESITALGLYLAPGADPEQVIAKLRGAARGRQALLIRSNAELRAISMDIFERTFVITRVLYWLAAGVASVGLVSALLAWELERTREVALLRALGLTPRGAALLVALQTLFMGLVALLAAVPAGLLTALVLTEVINRRAFGWHIDLHLRAAQFGNALLLAAVAALVAAAYPAWRQVRAPISGSLREE